MKVFLVMNRQKVLSILGDTKARQMKKVKGTGSAPQSYQMVTNMKGTTTTASAMGSAPTDSSLEPGDLEKINQNRN